jgi:hypothetical protein
MEINTFYSHSIQERLHILNQSGEFIVKIKYYWFYLSLYIVDNQFIEVYCNINNGNIEAIEILDPKNERLHLYAIFTNLSDLFQK